MRLTSETILQNAATRPTRRSHQHGSGLLIAIGCSLILWAALAQAARWAVDLF